MIRQSLDEDSAYVNIALHGDGLTSLQFRDAKAAEHPRSPSERLRPRNDLRIEKRGKYVSMFISGEDGARLLGAANADRVRRAVLRRPRRLRYDKDGL